MNNVIAFIDHIAAKVMDSSGILSKRVWQATGKWALNKLVYVHINGFGPRNEADEDAQTAHMALLNASLAQIPEEAGEWLETQLAYELSRHTGELARAMGSEEAALHAALMAKRSSATLGKAQERLRKKQALAKQAAPAVADYITAQVSLSGGAVDEVLLTDRDTVGLWKWLDMDIARLIESQVALLERGGSLDWMATLDCGIDALEEVQALLSAEIKALDAQDAREPGYAEPDHQRNDPREQLRLAKEQRLAEFREIQARTPDLTDKPGRGALAPFVSVATRKPWYKRIF